MLQKVSKGIRNPRRAASYLNRKLRYLFDKLVS